MNNKIFRKQYWTQYKSNVWVPINTKIPEKYMTFDSYQVDVP